MIADGDSAAKNAFRVGLRVDTPLPTVGAGNGTQELDACDILEVQDMAEAIARAERPMKLARSAKDMFESLGTPPAGSSAGSFARAFRATDDTAGPATAAPPLTPIPPPMYPPVMPPEPPRYITVPRVDVPPAEDDAYFQPAGRLRTLADATLENYRPEPTLLVRARSRRKSYAWVIVAVLLPLVVLAAFEISARAGSTTPVAPVAAVTPTPTVAAPVTPTTTSASTPTSASTSTSTSASTSASTSTSTTTSTSTSTGGTKAKAKGGVPVFDVNSLPPAAGARTKPHGR